MNQAIRDKAKELLASGAVSCVIGYDVGSDGINARPFFAYTEEEADGLAFDQTCTHNLVKYLIDRAGKATAIVVKPCDARALTVLINEKQVKREEVFIIGAVCHGIIESTWGQKGSDLQGRCQTCTQHTPLVYDLLVGEPMAEPTPKAPLDHRAATLANMSVAERAAFWAEQFQRCLRCNACRQVCPGCYCAECFVDQLDPEWVGIRIDLPEKWLWNTIRAFHLAGRCVGCDECQRVCPVNIPLGLLNHKLEEEVATLFDFRPGVKADVPAPLETFKKDEKLGIGE
ncbi:MAG: 4Fe-4S dicluster domain-containing protein [Chloroflexi bacterium]|nr:4Fe-4S dicluster domain-containing protein [Chloroflexota bacterium]